MAELAPAALPPVRELKVTDAAALDALLARFSAACAKALPIGGRLVLTLPDPALLPQVGFRELYHYEWYVHGSLTRHLLVLEKT